MEETERVTAVLEGFGAGTGEGGWALRLNNAKQIPLHSGGLCVLVVSEVGMRPRTELRVTARIDILTLPDRWASLAFGISRTAAATALYDFPI
jgi:hypothetical protein